MKSECTDTVVHDMYVEYRAELCRYVMNSVGMRKDEAEDVVQTAFARVTQVELDSIRNGRAFLYKTCHNIAVDLKRRAQVRRRHEESISGAGGEVDELAPERFVDSGDELEVVRQALWAMPKKRRKILMMSRFDGLSYAEIARREGLSETVVRKHVAKALRDCQKAVQGSRR